MGFQTACSAPAAITAATITVVRCGCAVMRPAPARPRTGELPRRFALASTAPSACPGYPGMPTRALGAFIPSGVGGRTAPWRRSVQAAALLVVFLLDGNGAEP